MLINTKHIVMFDDAANDFGRIANMVDDDGAVLIIKDGRPAYAVVPFDEVQEAERPASGSTPKVEKVEEPKCGCGKPQSQCGCGGHGGSGSGCGGHGGHGHGHNHGGHSHGGQAGGEPRTETRPAGPGFGPFGGSGFGDGGFGGPFFGGGGGAGRTFAEHFGHGGDAGHLHPDGEPASPDNDWDFEFHAGRGFDPLFQGGPNFSVDEFIGKMPPEMVEAGKRFVSQLSPLIGLFGSGVTPTDNPEDK